MLHLYQGKGGKRKEIVKQVSYEDEERRCRDKLASRMCRWDAVNEEEREREKER